MTKRYTFVVVDDHPMIRRGLIETLLDQDDFEHVGEGETAADAIKLAKDNKPDLIILDVNMPGGGVEAAMAILTSTESVRVIMYSFRRDAEIVQACMAAGASAYIVKGTSATDLLSAVRRVLSGEIYIPPGLIEKLAPKP